MLEQGLVIVVIKGGAYQGHVAPPNVDVQIVDFDDIYAGGCPKCDIHNPVCVDQVCQLCGTDWNEVNVYDPVLWRQDEKR